MASSLIPEKPLLVYPSLAATVGLDEAVMLSALNDLVHHIEGDGNNGYQWYSLRREQIEQALPFWDLRDIQRVSTNLREKGIIIIASAPIQSDSQFKFAFNEGIAKSASNTHTQANPVSTRTSAPAHAPNRPAASGKNYIPANWQPSETSLAQLAQLNINTEFALQQAPEFITYWRERNEPQRSWDQKFISWVVPRWRSFEEQEHRRSKASVIPAAWQPTQECVTGLVQRKIPQQFVLDQVMEFVRYWQATGEQHIAWEAKFIQRVTSRWADMESKRNVSKEAHPISNQWRPSEDAMELMVVKSGIPLSFIEDTIAEFIIYWQEKGTQSNTWNSMFIKHVRLQWHRYQHAINSSDHNCEAHVIPDNWQPASDVFDILALANIDANFAHELVAEFILYWRERNELHRAWNSKFLQHAKRQWAMRHQFNSDPQSDNLRSTREISLEEELNDTSWAS
ncbi:MAG: hypothetical protein K6L76_11855 [Agarilytica sp.]